MADEDPPRIWVSLIGWTHTIDCKKGCYFPPSQQPPNMPKTAPSIVRKEFPNSIKDIVSDTNPVTVVGSLSCKEETDPSHVLTYSYGYRPPIVTKCQTSSSGPKTVLEFGSTYNRGIKLSENASKISPVALNASSWTIVPLTWLEAERTDDKRWVGVKKCRPWMPPDGASAVWVAAGDVGNDLETVLDAAWKKLSVIAVAKTNGSWYFCTALRTYIDSVGTTSEHQHPWLYMRGNAKTFEELSGMLEYDETHNSGNKVYFKDVFRWHLWREASSPSGPSSAGGPDPPAPAGGPDPPAPSPEPPGPAPAPNAADDTDMMLIGSVSLSSFCCVCLILIVFVMMQKGK
jgi:hypothetical protein